MAETVSQLWSINETLKEYKFTSHVCLHVTALNLISVWVSRTEKMSRCVKADQSDEAQASTARRPLRMLRTVSCGTSGQSRKLTTCLMMLLSLRISPMITHHSRQPASRNT